MSKGAGRPSKLTPETKERLFGALKRGAHLEAACHAASVDHSTVAEWIRRGEGRDRRSNAAEFAEFAVEIKKAIADAEMVLISKIRISAESDWRAASWILERRHPEHWANTQKVEVLLTKRLEEELNAFCSAIDTNPNIPDQIKLEIFKTAAQIQQGAQS